MDFLRLARDIDILEKNPETEENSIYLSRIEGISEGSILITPPFMKGSYCHSLQTEIGTILNARIAAEGCSYFFECELISFKDSCGEDLWEISLPMNMRRVQRREHVRLSIALDVKIEFMDEKKKIITTFTKDLSAGGVQVVLEEPLPEDSDIHILLPLTDEIAIEAKGEIVRVIFPKTPRGMITTAIKFIEFPEEKQEEITKYIFQKEVHRRQKDKQLFGKSLR
ncbi:flagellar brake protein [Pelosinus sp. sgz500959]|uniref:flagellar brake protein n=1 Tax=Pelosinus sp. sgz500959 TaxID=3242472 RepID=UPI00366CA655